jgi:hypothetical protein
MKFNFRDAALCVITLGATTVLAQDGCYQEKGNLYCSAADLITYTNFGSPGSYDRVTGMDPNSKTCQTSKQSFGGGMAPFDAEVSC